jgi:hypothetical protein
MNIIAVVLNKVVTKEFYRSNASFFLVVIGICCGFMSKIEHMALAEFFTSSIMTLFIPFALWLLYTLKIIEFNRKVISLNENGFIINIRALGYTTQLFNYLMVATAELLPVIIYGFFLITIAHQHHSNDLGICLILMMTILIGLITFFLYQNIAEPVYNNAEWKITQRWNKIFHRSIHQISLEWMLRNEFFLLTGNKIFSLLVIIGTSTLYHYDTYDLRLMAMGITVATASHAMLIYRYHSFVEGHFSLLRNLPFPLTKRISHFLATFFVICLPDFGVLIRNFPDQLSYSQLAESLLLAAGIILFMFSRLYLKNETSDKHIAQVFVFTLVVIVLILFSISVWLLGLALILPGIAVYYSRYYRFEFVNN